MGLVDVFKFSGRLTVPMFDPKDAHHMKAVWYYDNVSKFKQSISLAGKTVYADDFNDVVANNMAPLHNWIPGWIDTRYTKEDYQTTYKSYDGIWSTEPGKRLEKILKSCRNQCWDCHECERTFGFQDVDSALQLRKVQQ
jgi:hypothetical protein